MQAKDTLNGADIYTGCNTLKIEFSKVFLVKKIQYLNFGQELIILHVWKGRPLTLTRLKIFNSPFKRGFNELFLLVHTLVSFKSCH